jgi:hypothetical protein
MVLPPRERPLARTGIAEDEDFHGAGLTGIHGGQLGFFSKRARKALLQS